VDFAVGAGVGYINMRGFYRQERTLKVARMAEIAEEIRSNASAAANE
jgi:hypothetical protein